MKEGRVGKKESRVRKLSKIVTTYNIVLNPINPLLSSVQRLHQIEKCVEPSRKSRKETEETIEPQVQKRSRIDEYLDQWFDALDNQLRFLQG